MIISRYCLCNQCRIIDNRSILHVDLKPVWRMMKNGVKHQQGLRPGLQLETKNVMNSKKPVHFSDHFNIDKTKLNEQIVKNRALAVLIQKNKDAIKRLTLILEFIRDPKKAATVTPEQIVLIEAICQS